MVSRQGSKPCPVGPFSINPRAYLGTLVFSIAVHRPSISSTAGPTEFSSRRFHSEYPDSSKTVLTFSFHQDLLTCQPAALPSLCLPALPPSLPRLPPCVPFLPGALDWASLGTRYPTLPFQVLLTSPSEHPTPFDHGTCSSQPPVASG